MQKGKYWSAQQQLLHLGRCLNRWPDICLKCCPGILAYRGSKREGAQGPFHTKMLSFLSTLVFSTCHHLLLILLYIGCPVQLILSTHTGSGGSSPISTSIAQTVLQLSSLPLLSHPQCCGNWLSKIQVLACLFPANIINLLLFTRPIPISQGKVVYDWLQLPFQTQVLLVPSLPYCYSASGEMIMKPCGRCLGWGQRSTGDGGCSQDCLRCTRRWH